MIGDTIVAVRANGARDLSDIEKEISSLTDQLVRAFREKAMTEALLRIADVAAVETRLMPAVADPDAEQRRLAVTR